MTEEQATALNVLIDLVSTASVSGGERAASEVFAGHARRLGYEASVDAIANAVAHRGAAADSATTHIVLLGHIDTVPGHIPVRLADGVLHGRGSVDAKGPLAAMLVAGARADLPEGVRLTVAGAVGEESAGSPGARKLVHEWRPDACIIGEPSGWDGVTMGYKGRLIVTGSMRRAMTHTAGRERSAGDQVGLWWRRLEDMVERMNRGRSSPFEVVQSTIRHMHTASDGIHERAEIQVGLRLPVGVLPGAIGERIVALAPEGVTVELEGPEIPHATDRNDPVVRALSSAIRSRGGRPHPKVKTGTADFNVVGPVWGCPIAAYGPGDSALDHTPVEHLRVEEFHRAVEVLTLAIETLAAELVEQSAAVC
jgi:LysW-gamma-L-lysine carboxypeptidase